MPELTNEQIHEAQQEGRWCFGCAKIKEDVESRYSFGAYAGKLCVECCKGYRDHCGIDQAQGRPEELEAMGETYWEEPI